MCCVIWDMQFILSDVLFKETPKEHQQKLVK